MHKKAHLTLKLSSKDIPQVKVGDVITHGDILVSVSGQIVDQFDLAILLGVKGSQAVKYATIKDGETVGKNTIIAQKKGFVKKQIIRSPLEGVFSFIDREKGIVGITKTQSAEEIKAWFSGIVSELTSEKLVFEIAGFAIPAKAGRGNPISGNLMIIDDSLDVFTMPIELENRILASKTFHTDMLAKADALGAVAVIVEEMPEYLESFPYVIVQDIVALKDYHGKSVIVYGDEKQVLVVEDKKGHKKE